MSTTAWVGASYAPRRWQAEALPLIIEELKKGNNPIVSAIMGSGKSILIAELVHVALQNLKEDRVIVVTAPRQSLVVQLTRTITKRCGLENVGSFYAHSKTVDKKVIVVCNASIMELASRLQNKPISLLIGDEVHGTESESFKGAYYFLKPACAVGFTATPFRSNKKESLSLWDSVAYRYDAAEAFRDGVIVPWELVPWNGEHFDPEQVNEICLKMIKDKGDGPGIVSALDIEDAENFSEFLNKSEIKAQAVHSKMSRSMRESYLRKLERGELDVIVHVSLLAEGVDMPWLMWLCLRRPVGARVRFVQEVGRVLRAHPDKDQAVIMDPHNLFGKHGLTYPESIGEMLVVDEDDEELASLNLIPEHADRVKKMPPATAMSEIDAWLTGMLSLLRVACICRPPEDNKFSDLWRDNPASAKQIAALKRIFWATKFLPENIREDFKHMCGPESLAKLKAGTVSDILDILYGIADASKEKRSINRYWHCPVTLPTPKIPIQGYLFAVGRI